jgi:glycosyltransferase involved in cell wall biosynthesis
MQAKGFDVYLISTCSFFGSPPIGRYLAGPTVLYLQEPHRWLYEAQDRFDPFPWLAAPLPRGLRDRVRYPGRAFLEMARTYRRSQRARFEVDNAHAFDQILVNSLFSRETVLRIYGVDAEVCYLGIDTEMFRPLGMSRENMVLGVGALSTHKKAHLLVDAVAQMAPPRPRLEWVAPSVDDDYLSRVRADARRCGVDFVLHLRASNDVLVEALNRARALVYAPRLEPFGLVPLEANACELPVVAVAEGGVRETVIDGLNGLLVKPTPDDLAKALERLLHEPALAEYMGQEGRRIVAERWSLDGAVTRLEKALLRLTEAESETRRIGYGTV